VNYPSDLFDVSFQIGVKPVTVCGLQLLCPGIELYVAKESPNSLAWTKVKVVITFNKGYRKPVEKREKVALSDEALAVAAARRTQSGQRDILLTKISVATAMKTTSRSTTITVCTRRKRKHSVKTRLAKKMK
jgi:hypothetical protein